MQHSMPHLQHTDSCLYWTKCDIPILALKLNFLTYCDWAAPLLTSPMLSKHMTCLNKQCIIHFHDFILSWHISACLSIVQAWPIYCFYLFIFTRTTMEVILCHIKPSFIRFSSALTFTNLLSPFFAPLSTTAEAIIALSCREAIVSLLIYVIWEPV